MGIFARLSNLIAANTHALMDRVENPEAMLQQVVRDMEEGLAAARQQAARAIAAERRVQRELNQNRAAADSWSDHARRALDAHREDLAREALTRKFEHDDVVVELTGQLAAAQQTSTEVKAALGTLVSRLAQVRRRLRVSLAEHAAARVRGQVARLAGAPVFDSSALLARFEHFENRLQESQDHLLAQVEVAQLRSGVESELADVEMRRRVDEALVVLKSSGATRLPSESSSPI